MDKKEKQRLGIVFISILFLAVYMDFNSTVIEENGTIVREDTGGEVKDVSLVADVEGILEEYSYELEIEPAKATEEEAKEYFLAAKKEIDSTFLQTEGYLSMRDSYASGLVKAEWIFSPSGYWESDGKIISGTVPEEGVLINAKVILECGEYEEIYTFPFRIEKQPVSQEERVKSLLDEWIEEQQRIEGTTNFQLPTEIDGIPVTWSEKREYYTVKILILEIIAIALIFVSRAKKQEQENRDRRVQMELEYPELVSQLVVLLEAGMTTRQAWKRISAQYMEKKRKHFIEEKPVFELIIHMNRRLEEGENERTAYQNFSNEIDVMCYRRLIRILLGNLEKGSKDICRRLDEEVRQAYEQRILLAKKLGEEASTKMLMPLMIMMLLVMAIVMAPAIMSFST